jgi:hypothetical protein
VATKGAIATTGWMLFIRSRFMGVSFSERLKDR